MRIFRIIGKSISNSFKSIYRNFSLSMASIVCVIITLLLVSIGILLSHNINNITTEIENELTIVILMDKDITPEHLTTAKESIEDTPNVNDVIFISKDQIKDDLSSQNETYQKIVDSWNEGENPLQDSYVITVVDVKDINETATRLKNIDNVDTVKYGETMVNDLINIFDVVKNSTIVLIISLALVTYFLVGNTIKITIFSRKNEIDIMRLVGTSNTVIKMPFVIEGFLLGAFGAIIPILITIIGYTYAYDSLAAAGMSNILGIISLASPGSIVYITSLILFALGSTVGMLGSMRAVRRYLTI